MCATTSSCVGTSCAEVGWRCFDGRAASAIPGKVRSGFPSGVAPKQRDRAVLRFRETMNRSSEARAPDLRKESHLPRRSGARHARHRPGAGAERFFRVRTSLRWPCTAR
ncbi:MAG: hypothetical protein EOS58_24440 [Mesorhizobium sp.]|nr:hypothetical protein EOA33_30715 [Mesorhizobium sp. M4A.F.Ca.ET.050.02.1.1]RVD42023.1 hypothetical protein EN742_08640 [Mesorhizobium sp. M4A.F.Ca.ET.020.02.1.1]RWC11405.1 MAG: hypothetical protein EOS53_27475 [Mesorhizobium sp.]RWD01967.1 MAG: hypothetical protein EOS58_24440 [Mesorhizobium sp.]RWD28054.1 MAG: hypothetical protein EOS22_11950 [Mesorhizobium sp.]